MVKNKKIQSVETVRIPIRERASEKGAFFNAEKSDMPSASKIRKPAWLSHSSISSEKCRKHDNRAWSFVL